MSTVLKNIGTLPMYNLLVYTIGLLPFNDIQVLGDIYNGCNKMKYLPVTAPLNDIDIKYDMLVLKEHLRDQFYDYFTMVGDPTLMYIEMVCLLSCIVKSKMTSRSCNHNSADPSCIIDFEVHNQIYNFKACQLTYI